ncbi:MAG TPA: Nif3-like dinuclear metal center hexameric protein [Hanamia sp.]|nr:Nif3-like dinuclear metal center hexameric protein [Hanamia sp.]
MKIKEIAQSLETFAPVSLQESYDNAGLIVGNSETDCKGIIISLDVTESVVEEAVKKNCNLIVVHHPVIFKGIKKLNGKNYVERTIISAIKNDIAIYAIHTNLDNVVEGVNKMIADQLNLQNCKVLLPKEKTLQKLVTFCPVNNAEEVRNALFGAGAGAIGKYDECSFNVEGTGTFRAGKGSHPFVGNKGERHLENETRIEVIFPSFLQKKIIAALKEAHPYEEVAYYLHELQNLQDDTGSGLIGEPAESLPEKELLKKLKSSFNLSVIKHTAFLEKPVTKIAVCGGAGIFLLPNAIAAGAQVYITSDIKYHEFFDADDQILLCDIGHYESEQFTVELLTEFLREKFPNFAVLKTEMNTNPVNYFL